MYYRELELVAACAVGITAAALCVMFEYVAGYGVLEMAFSAVCLFVIGAGAFVGVSDWIRDDRDKKAWKRHKRKQIDFRVGHEIPTMPGYVEVKN